MKLDHLLILYARINSNCSKWIKNLNVRLETIKILEENIGSKIWEIACSNISSDVSPQERETKQKKLTSGTITKSFCTAKETIYKMKR